MQIHNLDYSTHELLNGSWAPGTTSYILVCGQWGLGCRSELFLNGMVSNRMLLVCRLFPTCAETSRAEEIVTLTFFLVVASVVRQASCGFLRSCTSRVVMIRQDSYAPQLLRGQVIICQRASIVRGGLGLYFIGLQRAEILSQLPW